MRRHFALLMFTAVFPWCCIAAQDSAATLSIRGDIQKPTQWSVQELKMQFASQAQEIKFTAGMDKGVKVGTGIPLLSVIQAAAPKIDPRISHHNLKFLVILEAKDSYQSFFSLAELTPPKDGPALAFLVWDVDGKPLPEKEAPLRLVLSTSGDARQIYGVNKITLVDGVKLANQLKEKQ